MVVQADIQDHRVQLADLLQQTVAFFRVALDDAEFSVGQLARLVEDLHRHGRLAQVVQQTGQAE